MAGGWEEEMKASAQKSPSTPSFGNRHNMEMRRLACWLALASCSFAATPLFRASFEIPEKGPGKNWTVVRGAAITDAAVLHDGKKSLRLEADGSNVASG